MRPTHQGLDQIYPQRQTRATDTGACRHTCTCECTRAHMLSKERRPLLMTDPQAKASHSEQEQVGRRTPVGCFPSPTPWVGFSHTCSAPSRLSQLPEIMTVLGLYQHLEQSYRQGLSSAGIWGTTWWFGYFRSGAHGGEWSVGGRGARAYPWTLVRHSGSRAWAAPQPSQQWGQGGSEACRLPSEPPSPLTPTPGTPRATSPSALMTFS